MKTIGLIGGMSWESTALYYKIINETVKERLGGLHSAKCVLYSVDFDEIQRLQHTNEWKKTADILGEAGARLAAAGADFLLICTNTMHKVADDIEVKSGLPLLHIADAAGTIIQQAKLHKIGLLGTRFTMEESFYVDRLQEGFGIEAIVPDQGERNEIHRIIFEELCLGVMKDDSRARFNEIIAGLTERGAEGIILGCTEIALLVRPEDSVVPVFDTTALHARRAVELAFSDRAENGVV
ncbi:aspartate/glutamate racemase family protein [Paenibacillus tarimensis]|uniref:aspartate/glutamate racemase family protein n=1 Tax=Paenibacillus tarimensis TaxID=416012 RepID=UPI001F337BA9|nr:aspartate/glutamate racemase family protein [Paenibacillus tarimensis]MCF2944427.1 aspartate/glutamate racemase family protein [Paenibacillus tarimensis]